MLTHQFTHYFALTESFLAPESAPAFSLAFKLHPGKADTHLKTPMNPTNFSRLAATALLFSCLFGVSFCFAGDSAAGSPASIPHKMGSHMSELGLPNFGEVTPNLFRGAQPERDGYRTLSTMGVEIVVDMRGDQSEQSSVERLGMKYVSIPWDPHSPSDEIIARFLKVVEENPDKKIFVHCHGGIDRTGMAIASYRMAKEGWSAGEAMKEMKLFGFSGFHNLRFGTLARFEKDFPEHLKADSAFWELHAISR